MNTIASFERVDQLRNVSRWNVGTVGGGVRTDSRPRTRPTAMMATPASTSQTGRHLLDGAASVAGSAKAV